MRNTNGMRQTQFELALDEARRDPPPRGDEGVEPLVPTNETESPTTEGTMEEVCSRENLRGALRRVQANKGSPGVDGIRTTELPAFLKRNWPTIRFQLLNGTYAPKPVKRVEIPKPDGGVRKLGIPTVLDRFIQQAVLQVLQERWDGTFSAHSYGFRPNRSAHQAVAQAQKYIAEGNGWVVDIDLEKFFDRVNHDILMGRVAKRVSDLRLCKLIRAFLNAGVMENGLVSPTKDGTPQGGPLSPLLSNLMLDDLDRELEKRNHRFVRYADDCNIYVASERAGRRVMESVTRFITKRLKLKVNEAKSAVARPQERTFLGFTFGHGPNPKRKIAPKSIRRFKNRVRAITKRNRGVSLEEMIRDLGAYLTGWAAYFRFCESPTALSILDGWIRRRLRAYVWKQWRYARHRFDELRRRGVNPRDARLTASSRKGPWRSSSISSVNFALSIAYFQNLGLPSLRVQGEAAG